MVINDLTISLLILVGIRFIAFIMFALLYIQNKRLYYLVLTMGWLIYMLGPIPDLIRGGGDTGILHPFFGFSAAVGTYLLMISVILSYRKIKTKTLITVITSVILLLTILIIVNPLIGGHMAVMAQGLFLISVLVLAIIKSRYLKNTKSNISFFWLCTTLGFGLINAFFFPFFLKNTPLSLRFAFTSLINVSLLEYLVYMDWEKSFKKLNESDKRYRFLFNTAPVPLFEEDSSLLREHISKIESTEGPGIKEYFDQNPEDVRTFAKEMNLLEVNNQTLVLFEAESRDELLSNIDSLFVDDTYVSLFRSASEFIDENGYSSFETVIRTLTGKLKEVLVSCYYPEKINHNKKTIISMVDISEKNDARKAIEASLKEKEILLQEVHHRVKNNLAIISSILGMQHTNATDSAMKELINSISNRISTLAIVHDQLYSNKDLEEIDVADYIMQITDGLQINFYNESKPVRFNLDIIPARFTINLLIPLGMLINEIVSNSFQHAFEMTEEPEVKISLYTDEDRGFVLSIKDNGSGFSTDDFDNRSESTGFIIIDALAHQINADFMINTDEGTEFRLILSEEMVKH